MPNKILSNVNNKYLFRFIICAILIKFLLFFFLAINAPQSSIQNDSHDYLETAKTLSSQRAFAKVNGDGSLSYELFRTPGYPFLLAILMGLIKLPINGVIFIQILLTLLVGFIAYKAAYQIDHRIAFLSLIIVLYDPVISIFSLMILTDTLFLFLMSLFMFVFIKYLKNNKFTLAMASALLLIMATYVRPVGYYLGAVLTIFIIYANLRFKNIKKAIFHALVFWVLIYSFFGIWESRNYKLTGQRVFSNGIQGIPSAYGLFKSFSRNNDPLAKQGSPVVYYIKTTSRCFLSLMTRPGPFKYFKSVLLSGIGKVLSYIWMIFWMIGFIIGIVKIRGNIYYQFLFLVILYFITVSIVGTALGVGERLRIPMIPFIALISSFGWSFLMLGKRERLKE